MKQKIILFVCNGNRFRSMSAEYLLKKYLTENHIDGYSVGSVGLRVQDQKEVHAETISTLQNFDIDVSKHVQRFASSELLSSADILVAVAQDQFDYLKSAGYKHVYLFDELASGKADSIWDIEDEVPDYQTNREAVIVYIRKTIHHIHDLIPKLFSAIAQNLSEPRDPMQVV